MCLCVYLVSRVCALCLYARGLEAVEGINNGEMPCSQFFTPFICVSFYFFPFLFICMSLFPSIFFCTISAFSLYGECVCVCVFSSHSFWASSSLDLPAVVTQAEGYTGFLIHLSAVGTLIFLARRIQPFLDLVDREV